MFPLAPGWRLTADFNQERQVAGGGTKLHQGWDLAPDPTDLLRAPEAGEAYLHLVLRGWATERRVTIDQLWPDGAWYPFSNYYADTYGGIIVLVGETCTWLFCHIDAMELGRMAAVMGLRWSGDKVRAPRGDRYEWIRPYLTLADPWTVAEGAALAPMGVEGVDTGRHVHMECHPPGGRLWARIDPAAVFPAEAEAGAG